MALNNLGLGFVITAKDAASAAFEKVKQTMGGMQDSMKEGGVAMQNALGKVQEYGAWMKDTGKAGIDFLKGSASAAGEFTKQLKVVSSAAGDTKFPVKEVHDLAMKMATTYGTDLMSQAKNIYGAIQSGATTAADAEKMLTAANKLAVNTQIDLNTAMGSMDKIMDAYGMSYDDAIGLADKFTVANHMSDISAGELGGSLGRVAVMAKTAGVGIDDMLAALITMNRSGMSVQEGMAGLRLEMAAIMKPSKTAQEEAKRLGIEFNAAALRSKGLVPLLQSIAKSANYNEDSLSKLFGVGKGMSAMAALLGDKGEFLSEAFDKMKNSAGAADKAFKDIGVSAKKLLEANLEAATVLIGEVVKPAFDALTKATTFAVKAFVALPKPIRTALVAIFGVGSVLLLVTGTLIGLVAAIAGAVAAFAAIGWEVIAVALGVIVDLLAAMGAAMAVAGGIAYAFYKAIQQNIGGIGTYFEESSKRAALAMDAIQQIFASGSFSGAVAAELSKAENAGITAFVTNIWLLGQRIWGFLQGVGSGFQAVLGGMGPTFSALAASLQRISDAFTSVQDKPAVAGAKWEAFSNAGKKIGEALGSVFNTLVQVITFVTDAIGGLAGGMSEIGGAFKLVWNAVMLVVEAYANVFAAFGRFSSAGSSSISIWKAIGAVITVLAYAIAGVVYVIGGLVGVVVNFGANLLGMCMGVFSGIAQIASGFIDILVGIFTGDWPRVWNGAGKVVTGFVKMVISTIMGLVSALAGIVDSIASMFGKDLGLSKTVDKWSDSWSKSVGDNLFIAEAGEDSGKLAPATAAPGAGPPPASAPMPAATPSAATSPAVATAGAGATNNEALVAALNRPPPPPPPMNITHTTQLMVDGQTLADTVERYASGPRSFNPTPTPA